MHPLEVLTPIILGICLLWPVTGKKRPPAVGFLSASALGVIAAHANIEGMRWQMRISFFDMTLRNRATNLFDASSRTSLEVRFER